MKTRCTPSPFRRISRWENEAVLEAVQLRLDRMPDAMTVRRRTVEHLFGTFKHWMGYTHFLTRRLGNVSTEMSLNVLAYKPQASDKHPRVQADDGSDASGGQVSPLLTPCII